MRLIDTLEPVRRGWYCGAIGFLSVGAASLSVAIRTATLQPDGRVDYGAGGGIVADSDPHGELAESLDKAVPFLRAVGATGSAVPDIARRRHPAAGHDDRAGAVPTDRRCGERAAGVGRRGTGAGQRRAASRCTTAASAAGRACSRRCGPTATTPSGWAPTSTGRSPARTELGFELDPAVLRSAVAATAAANLPIVDGADTAIRLTTSAGPIDPDSLFPGRSRGMAHDRGDEPPAATAADRRLQRDHGRARPGPAARQGRVLPRRPHGAAPGPRGGGRRGPADHRRRPRARGLVVQRLRGRRRPAGDATGPGGPARRGDPQRGARGGGSARPSRSRSGR
jgi:hypothetical protein